jgi:hypothetical protein
VWEECVVDMSPVGDHAPVIGSYISALLVSGLPPSGPCIEPIPPAIRTVPFGIRVALCPKRPIDMLAVGDHVLATGSYNSALLSGGNIVD